MLLLITNFRDCSQKYEVLYDADQVAAIVRGEIPNVKSYKLYVFTPQEQDDALFRGALLMSKIDS